MEEIGKYSTTYQSTACPGCGLYGVNTAIKQAWAELKLKPEDIVMTYDIGCNGNEASTFKVYGLKSLHGRALAAAIGVAQARDDLTVMSMAGDGGALQEGIQHLIAAVRNDLNITFLLTNNLEFALTTGQYTATVPKGRVSKTAPWGVKEIPINPCSLVLTLGGTFAGRVFAGELIQMKEVIKAAIKHRGFSFIEVYQPCVTFNKVNTFDWYKARVKDVTTMKGYDKTDREKALKLSQQVDKEIPIGLLFHENTQ